MISSFIQLSYVTIIIYFDVHFIPRLVSRILFKVTVSYCNVAISYLSISLLCDINMMFQAYFILYLSQLWDQSFLKGVLYSREE